MMIKKLAALFGAAAVMLGIAAGTAIPASAANNIKPFGTEMTLKYPDVEVGYTVDGLSPSTDVIPFQINGRLWESMVTVNAIRGSIIPVVPFFRARADDGTKYPVLSNVWTPQGLSGASLPPGGQTSGKIYFDVVGPDPTNVSFSDDGVQDLLLWVG